MIKEVTMYTILCDGCGKDLCEGSEYSCWNDKDAVNDIAVDSDWMREGDRYYCPNCWTWGDDDSLIFKTKSEL